MTKIKQTCPVDFDKDQICKIIECLNVYLANLNIMYIKLHNLHWNVVGKGFFDLHSKTQELYEKIAEELDLVAERIKALGSFPLASMQDYLQATTICEIPSKPYSSSDVPQIIIDDFCCTLNLLREIETVAKEASDECTVGLLASSMCFFQKHIWMMDAYLERC
ncbi:MAG: Ferritin Dps family protein [Firmicutes bacterium]|nr:Ferritin Dps family protein [Bacillota bacterium]